MGVSHSYRISIVRLWSLPLLTTSLLLGSVSCSDYFNSKTKIDLPADLLQRRGDGPNSFDPDFAYNSPPFSEEKMLVSIGLNVIAPATVRLRSHLENLHAEIRVWLTNFSFIYSDPTQLNSLDFTASDPRLSFKPAQLAWKAAMLSFQFLDGAPFGPLADKQGQMKNQFYGWPDFNSCGVVLETAKQARGDSAHKDRSYTIRGLTALEYLLFDPFTTTECNNRNPQHKLAIEWVAKSLSEKQLDRMRHALILTNELLDLARALEASWDPAKWNFTKSLIDGSRFAHLKDASNSVTDALFSIERVKDQKLGQPLGLHRDCISASRLCPEAIEHRYSGLSLEAMLWQLNGFRAVFTGDAHESNKTYGIDDLLKSIGHESVAQQVLNQSATIVQYLRDVMAKGEFSEQILALNTNSCHNSLPTQKSRNPLCLVHDGLRTLVTTWKTSVLAAMSLRSPTVHQGDSD